MEMDAKNIHKNKNIIHTMWKLVWSYKLCPIYLDQTYISLCQKPIGCTSLMIGGRGIELQISWNTALGTKLDSHPPWRVLKQIGLKTAERVASQGYPIDKTSKWCVSVFCFYCKSTRNQYSRHVIYSKPFNLMK